jgi:hypothetical protein
LNDIIASAKLSHQNTKSSKDMVDLSAKSQQSAVLSRFSNMAKKKPNSSLDTQKKDQSPGASARDIDIGDVDKLLAQKE